MPKFTKFIYATTGLWSEVNRAINATIAKWASFEYIADAPPLKNPVIRIRMTCSHASRAHRMIFDSPEAAVYQPSKMPRTHPTLSTSNT
jgi:hypothetical protein